MNKTLSKIYTGQYTVEPAQGDAQGNLPLPQLVRCVLETATLHATEWGIGYRQMVEERKAWVLGRFAMELNRLPRIEEEFSIETWIDSLNSRFSERNFAIIGCNNEVIGYARSIWFVIDLDTRRSIDITSYTHLERLVQEHTCPIEKPTKLPPVHDLLEHPRVHTVVLSDIDLNRHMNTTRYIECILNHFDLQTMDTHHIARFEINFMSEALFGASLYVHCNMPSPLNYHFDITNAEGNSHIRASITLQKRDKQ